MDRIERMNAPILPNICTLVGPTKHYQAFDRASVALGRRGWLVFSVGSHRANDEQLHTSDVDRRIYWHTHRQKIFMSSLVFVVDLKTTLADCSPYVGKDTKDEIGYAEAHGVPVVYMSGVWHGRGTMPIAPGYEGAPMRPKFPFIVPRPKVHSVDI